MNPKYLKNVYRLACLVLAGILGSAWSARAQTEYAVYPELTCQTFIQDTLQADPQFNQALQKYLQSRYAVLSAQTMADLTLGASAGWTHAESTSGSIFEPESIDTLSYQVSLKKLFFESGTRLTLSHENGLSSLDYAIGPAEAAVFGSAFDLAAESSQPKIKLAVIQPLLKNAFGLAERFPLISAQLLRQAAEIDAKEAWEKRLSELYGAYFDWAAAYENLMALRGIVAELQRLEEQISRKVQSGVAERTDLLRTRDNVLTFQGQLTQAEGAWVSATRQIASLRQGRAATDPAALQIRPDLSATAPVCSFMAGGSAGTQADQLRLIKKLELFLRQAKEREAVALANRLPQVDLVGEVAWKGRADDRLGGYGSLQQRDYGLFVQAQLPLGGWQANGELGQARSAQEELKESLAATRESLMLTMAQMAETIRRLTEVETLQQEQVKNAEEKSALDLRNYRIGRLDTFYLIDSQNALTNARLNRVRTQIQLKRFQLEYLSLTDQLLAGFPELEKRLTQNVED